MVADVFYSVVTYAGVAKDYIVDRSYEQGQNMAT